MPRNAGDPLNLKNPLCGNLFPLGHSLGGHRPNGLGKGGRATSSLFGKFTCVFHTSIESISFNLAQAPLSMKVRLS